MHIPLLDLKAQYQAIKPELDAALMEVVASLVRMAEIDYLEAQRVMAEVIQGLKPAVGGAQDISQSFPAADIASMRHEASKSRMFIS